MKDKKQIYPVNDKIELASQIKNIAHKGDLIIGLGAGDISKMMHEMPTLLNKQEGIKCGNY